MTVIIEHLDDQQWSALRDLRLAALADSPQAFWATLAEEGRYDAEEWTRFLRAVGWFVASRDARPVGLVGALRRPEIADEIEVIAMWVEPLARRRGTAALLLGALREWARTQDTRSLTLWVIDGNEQARRLYERHGFRATGESDVLPTGRFSGADRDERMRRYVCAVSSDGAATVPPQ